MQMSAHFRVLTHQLNMNRYGSSANEKKRHSSCRHRIMVFRPVGSQVIQLFLLLHGNKEKLTPLIIYVCYYTLERIWKEAVV
jgi:hypothetical protein